VVASNTNQLSSRIAYRRRALLLRVLQVVIPVATGLIILVAWLLMSNKGDIPAYILPSPRQVVTSLINGLTANIGSRGSIIYHLERTATGAVVGFLVGSSLGILMGSVIAEFSIIQKGVLPYFYALQGLPKLALAPLVMVWFGFGPLSTVAVSCLATYFPLLVNTVAALGSTDRDALDMMRALGASRWTIFKMLKFPGAMPVIFAGLRMSVVYSILGSILAEFTAGDRGLGFLINQQRAVLNTPGMFASMIVLAILSAVMSAIVRRVEDKVLFWTRFQDIAVVG
jgi:NitT/TauT family transport system permease protein